MEPAVIVAIVLLLAVVAALTLGTGPLARRRRLRRKFGPEYDRLVGKTGSRRQAETELAERERRVRELRLHDLTDSERVRYQAQWADAQERFVDAPAEAVGAAQRLVEAVMRARGYPVAGFEQMVVDLSVQHARTLDLLRSAHEVRLKGGKATTEELRVAMLRYRRLFGDLIGRSIEPDGQSRNRDGRTLLRIR